MIASHSWIASLVVLATLTACDDDGAAPDDALQQHVDALADTGVVGVQAVASKGGTQTFASAGVAALGDAAPIASGTRFRIASTSKTFVATVALQLVEDGTLALDEPVAPWLPDVALDPTITLRQLLQHTSGVPNHVDDLVGMLMAAQSSAEIDAILQRTWQPAELVELALAREAPFEPGGGWAYSDTNYVLVGMIVHAATGEPWAQQVRARIVVPLGLDDTTAPGADPTIDGPHMHGYAALPFADGPTDVTAINPSSLDAAAALVSTPADVDRFFAALLGGELLGAGTLAQMQSTVDVGDGSGMRYGLGLAWAPSACSDEGYWTHAGDTLGYHTRNGVSSDGERSVTIAISGDGDFDHVAAELVDAVICS